MSGQQPIRGFFRGRIGYLLNLLGIFVLPAAHCVQKGSIQKRLALKTHDVRMYAVGVINKVSRSICGKSTLAPAASSIVSILKAWDMPRLPTLIGPAHSGLLDCVRESPSQMGQDALAIILCGSGGSRYFVEAGACDGVFSSNTWILESRLGWKGLLVEPGRVWHRSLMKKRKCHIDTRALWRTSGEALPFRETELPNLSTLEGYSDRDMHAMSRQQGTSYEVSSVSLQDVLRENEAPAYIDFLSLDTEGTEFEILRTFPFEDYSFGVIACEHNNTDSFEQVRDLLTAHNYLYLHELACISLGDAWFVGPHLEPCLDFLRAGRSGWTKHG